MSKKEEKFRDIWVNQGALGKALNLSAVAIGKRLKELELRQEDDLKRIFINPFSSFFGYIAADPYPQRGYSFRQGGKRHHKKRRRK